MLVKVTAFKIYMHVQEKESIDDHTVDMDCDSGAENLDLMIKLMEEHGELQSKIVRLCNSFGENVGERMKTRCTVSNGFKEILFRIPRNN